MFPITWPGSPRAAAPPPLSFANCGAPPVPSAAACAAAAGGSALELTRSFSSDSKISTAC
ncbi:hypothetical protein M5D96_008929 [Drosophila gunungcola]|uniref:Uncharacterized protein n=1 Tax=Drosophila gunungcola TaxID=103775 RepID=A0A9Q0BNN2_9MUSC|nr:hypothetical protein M5D96_008929 [Drosophila gunungcola]